MILNALEYFPQDKTIFALVLLKAYKLKPFDALFLEPNVLHSYQKGTGVEIMNKSDNVIRAGLTTKYVDKEELMKTVDFTTKVGELKIVDHFNGVSGVNSIKNSIMNSIAKTYFPKASFALSVFIVRDDSMETVELNSNKDRIAVFLGDNFQITTKDANATEQCTVSRGEAVKFKDSENVKIKGNGMFVVGFAN
jgi:mannose-6-phosphate isomerase class I